MSDDRIFYLRVALIEEEHKSPNIVGQLMQHILKDLLSTITEAGRNPADGRITIRKGPNFGMYQAPTLECRWEPACE